MTGFAAKPSTFSQGFMGGLNVRGVNLGVNDPGKTFWVGDGDTAGNTPSFPNRKTPSDGNNGTFLAPYATIDNAIEQCVAGRGDKIYVLPGYVQDCTAETAVVMDVAGVQLLGLGQGGNQAQLTYSAAAGLLDVEAADCRIEGLRFTSTVTVATNAIEVDDGSDDLVIHRNRFDSSAATTEFVSAISVVTSDRVVVTDNVCQYDDAADGAESWLFITGGDDIVVDNNRIVAPFLKAPIEVQTTAPKWLTIANNTLVNGGADALEAQPLIDDEVATTSGAGLIANNTLVANVASADAIETAGTEVYFLAGNSYSQTASVNAVDGLGDKVMLAAQDLNRADETGTDVFVVTGDVDVWFVHGIASTAGDGTASDISLGVEGDATALWAATEIIIDDEMAAAGDHVSSATAGGAQVGAEVGALPAVSVWPSPLRITGGSNVDILQNGTGGAGVLDLTIYYTRVSADGNIT